jgi:hypothetical protein
MERHRLQGYLRLIIPYAGAFFALQEDSFRRQMLRMNAFDGKVKREKEKMGRYGEKG